MKAISILMIFGISIVLSACGPRTQPSDDRPATYESVFISESHQAFFDNLASLCGNSFAGEQIYRSHHGDSWADFEMIMHVEVCEEDQILIPFHVGEDQSRTWMFLAEDGKLRFRHDHRYPDGTPEEQNLYGGYADNTGNAFVQHFPADAHSAAIIEDGGGNIWTVALNEDLTTFTYRLERDGGKRLRIDFDLSNPL